MSHHSSVCLNLLRTNGSTVFALNGALAELGELPSRETIPNFDCLYPTEIGFRTFFFMFTERPIQRPKDASKDLL